jgi:hypothetical protein
VVAVIASILSTLLANNLGRVAQGVVDKGLEFVEDKLGLKLDPVMTPDQIENIRAAAQRHEEFRIEQDNLNTANARNMQVAALDQDDLFSKRFVYYLASFWSVVSAAYVGAVTFVPIPKGNERVLDTVLGFLLGTIVATIINYFMGSSSGSAAKNEILLSNAVGKQTSP